MNAKIVRNTQRNGINVSFDHKPTDEVLQFLKGLGFRWQPYEKYWYKTYSEQLEAKVKAYFEGKEVPVSEIYDKENKKSGPMRKLQLKELFAKHKAPRKDVIIAEIISGKMEYAVHKSFDGMTDSTNYHKVDNSSFMPAEDAKRTYNDGTSVNFIVDDLKRAIGQSHWVYSARVKHDDELGYYIDFSDYYIRYKGETGEKKEEATGEQDYLTVKVGDVLKVKDKHNTEYVYIAKTTSDAKTSKLQFEIYRFWNYGINNENGRFGIRKDVFYDTFKKDEYEPSTSGHLLYFISNVHWNIADTYQNLYGNEIFSVNQKYKLLQYKNNEFVTEILRMIDEENKIIPEPDDATVSPEQKAVALIGANSVEKLKEAGIDIVYGIMKFSDAIIASQIISGTEMHKLGGAGLTLVKSSTKKLEPEFLRYDFRFHPPANAEGKAFIEALPGIGALNISTKPDFINGIEFNYKLNRYRVFDNTGEFKIDDLNDGGYLGVIYFKETDENLKTIPELIDELKKFLDERIDEKSATTQEPVTDEIAIAKAKAKARIRILKLKAQISRQSTGGSSFGEKIKTDIEKKIPGVQITDITADISELQYEPDQEFEKGGNIPVSKQFFQAYDTVRKARDTNVFNFAQDTKILDQYNAVIFNFLVSEGVPVIKVDEQKLKTHSIFKIAPPPIKEAVFWCTAGYIKEGHWVNNIYVSLLPRGYQGVAQYAIKLDLGFMETFNAIFTHESIHAYYNIVLLNNAMFERELALLREKMHTVITQNANKFNEYDKRIWSFIYGAQVGSSEPLKQPLVSEVITYSFTLARIRHFFESIMIEQQRSAWDMLISLISMHDKNGILIVYAQKHGEISKLEFTRAVMKYKTYLRSGDGIKKMEKGGKVEGLPHEKGGEDFTVKSTGQQVELEGGEAVIMEKAVNSRKTYTFEGQKVKPKDILDKINRDHGGNPIK